MANLTLTSTWEADIYELATTDPVLGGPGGIANQQAQQLGNRTKYLYDQFTDHEGRIVTLESARALSQLLNGKVSHSTSGAVTLNATNVSKLNVFTGAPVFTLPTSANMTGKDKAVIGFLNANTDNSFGTFAAGSGTSILNTNGVPLGPDDSVLFQYDESSTTWYYVAYTKGGVSAPVGAVQAFARDTAPTGWIECNGAAVLRSTYARLFGVISTAFGAGNGTTTFNIPDLRGEFIRGWDNGRGIDTGRTFGSAQSDDFKSHAHSIATVTAGAGGAVTVAQGATGGNLTGSTGGTETRPRNIAMMYCIKY